MTLADAILNILAANDNLTSTELRKKIRNAGFSVPSASVPFEEKLEEMGFTRIDHGTHGAGRKITWTL